MPQRSELILISQADLEELARKLAKIIREENPTENENNWISPAEALKMLNVTNKVTLQRLRDAGKIRFSQPQKKIILYDKQSIIDYLNNNSKNSFRKI